MPDAKIASVSVSRTENFKDELPQLMIRIRQGAGTPEQWPNADAVVKIQELQELQNPEPSWVLLQNVRQRVPEGQHGS